jgi:hypothetical protein
MNILHDGETRREAHRSPLPPPSNPKRREEVKSCVRVCKFVCSIINTLIVDLGECATLLWRTEVIRNISSSWAWSKRLSSFAK